MKRKLLFVMLLTALCALFGGCQDKKEKLYVYNWGEYIDPEVIEAFEEEYDIKVVYSTFDSNEEMYAKLKSGTASYDVICPSDYMINRMAEEGLLQELNKENIPNLENIGAEYLTSSQQFDPGNKYSVPYCWGTVGILYNKTKVKGEITSWSALFDEQYKGQILMIDSVRDAYMTALCYLGYSQNTTNKDEIQEATKLLQSQAPLVQAYVVDQVRDKMVGNEAVLGVIYSGEAIYTQRSNADLVYVVPEEGSNVWIDSWVVPKDAQNVSAAEKWIDYMCRPEVALKNFDFITYSTPNTAAQALIEDEDVKNSPIAFPDNATLARCETFQFLGEDNERFYLDEWAKVK
ncbi:MAG: ABC transporter substrate-binding protein [Lachnospiraceae bacterium]|nr:ABC transporter substrate-binding protein [Lachnospiraceae bacterium]